ncbi:cupin domain-containing protein [Gordonia sp. Z-3]|uniref:Cupin domain-containing protein n=1 Tax=Gordonia aquimaris TaxID=2984863 RepID=A0A9X3I7N4_9ACTN|nr:MULTISPECIES: cupin domain-containing protein [Gordonia]MCX2966749.1 cupin domain-containing protein [Gordonia aquimaris]MED5803230.1 cupin domain-containing protein [Gordonia sp. Z-3]
MTDFVPMTIAGERHGSVHFIRDDRRNDRVNRVAVWELTDDQLPYEAAYEFRSDETMLIVQGELRITFANGSSTVFRAGDIVSVAAGTKSTWRINEPFRKFVVETGVAHEQAH